MAKRPEKAGKSRERKREPVTTAERSEDGKGSTQFREEAKSGGVDFLHILSIGLSFRLIDALFKSGGRGRLNWIVSHLECERLNDARYQEEIFSSPDPRLIYIIRRHILNEGALSKRLFLCSNPGELCIPFFMRTDGVYRVSPSLTRFRTFSRYIPSDFTGSKFRLPPSLSHVRRWHTFYAYNVSLVQVLAAELFPFTPS